MSDDETRIGGRYRLVRQLATGGMGTVWEGWDDRLHRPVAVKKLGALPGLTGPDADVAALRVMREARLTARLHHPNAVQVFDVVDDRGRPCLIMQYVPSRSLQDIVRDEGPLDPTAVGRIGTQVAAALAAAHRAGIVHRDVKPGNILIADDGTAKITDFGISHAIDDVTLTSTGLVTGTPAYLAPEIARGAESNFASDVYSLGATLYMAVEGAPPSGTDSNPMATLHRVASGDTNPPVRSGPLTGMLLAMLAIEPAQRPEMVDIATRLTDLRSGPPETDVTRAIARPQGPQEPPEPRRPQEPPLAPLPQELSPRPQELSPHTMALEPPPRGLPGGLPPLLPVQPEPAPRATRAMWPVLVAALLVIALGIVLGVVLLTGNDTTGTTATGGTSGPPVTHSSQSNQSASHSSRPPKSSAAGSTHARPGPPSASQLASAVTDYYDVVPGNLAAGWQRLSRHFQTTKAQNRQQYDYYWNTVRRVDVLNTSGQPPSSATATLRYYYKNGRTTVERTKFFFVRRAGILKIYETEVLG
ncbi:MAG TPA: serine/threonine-protein kinase [Jatrophihabitans sp.]